jgi:hypothetical protein
MTETTYREAYNYVPPARCEQGSLIEEIKAIARHPISDEETRTTRCMTLKSVDRVCYKIAMNEDKLSQTKVYIALMTIGYKARYHNKMQDNPDALHVMEPVMMDCAATCDLDVIDMVMGYTLFKGAQSRAYRLDKAKMGEAEKESMGCGVDRSELNLFNVLAGMERVLTEEPYYIERQDERLFRAPMDEFLSAKRKLEFRLVSLRGILAMG